MRGPVSPPEFRKGRTPAGRFVHSTALNWLVFEKVSSVLLASAFVTVPAGYAAAQTAAGAGLGAPAWAQVWTGTGDRLTALDPALASNSVLATLGADAPHWNGLTASAGTGYANWISSGYDVMTIGKYVLAFGLPSGFYQSGLASNGIGTGQGPVLPAPMILGPIDRMVPYYLASAVGLSVNPIFTGGTLRADLANGVYSQNFTLDGSITNTIDQSGNESTFAGRFSDGTVGVSGNIIFANSGNGGSVTLLGANSYSGTTMIESQAHLIVGPGGSISNANIQINSGFLEVNAQGSVAAATLFNNGFGIVINNGTMASDLSNAGLAINTGLWNGNVLNNSGITINGGTWNGSFSNNSGLAINIGRWNGDLSNNSSFAINGGIWNGNLLNNKGLVFNGGTWNGSLSNNSGLLFNGATWNGGLSGNTGTVLNYGTWNAPVLNNDGGSVTNTGTVNAGSGITNTGTIDAQGTVNTPSVDNSGQFNVTGPLTGTIGTFDNSGTLNLANGKTTDVVQVGSYQGQGGQLVVDADLSNNSNTVRGDVLQAGTVSGTTAVSINNIASGRGYFATPIPIIQSGGGDARFDLVGVPSAGLVDYNLAEVSLGNWSLVSSINPRSASFSASMAASALALNTGFFQNASSFVTLPESPEPNKWAGGPWIRIVDGRNDVDAIGTTPNGYGGARQAASLVRTQFNGFQTGVDLGLYNIENSGFSALLGVTAGRATLNSTELSGYNSTNAIQVPFIGIYGLFAGHGFFADFQVREDFYDMHLSYPAAYVQDNSLSGTSLGVNGSIGYHWAITKDFFVEPTAALIYSDLHVNGLRVGIDPANDIYGTVTFQPIESLLGRFGGRIGTTYVREDIGVVTQPFLIANIWREFAGDVKSTFNAQGSAVPISLTRVGTFGQIGLGISGSILNTGLVGFFHGDYRIGDQIHGYALNAGLRYQF